MRTNDEVKKNDTDDSWRWSDICTNTYTHVIVSLTTTYEFNAPSWMQTSNTIAILKRRLMTEAAVC